MDKKNRFGFRNSKIFIRFFLGVLTISVVSVLVLASVIFYWFQGKMQQDIATLKKTELQITATVFSDYMRMAEDYTRVLYKSPHLKTIMLSTKKQEWNSSYSAASAQVQSILTLNSFINSIYIMNPDGIAFFAANRTETTEAQQLLLDHVKNNPSVVSQPMLWDMELVSGNIQPTLYSPCR